MHVFFQKIAERLGFEKEWERYHSENEKESVRLKSQIDSIFTTNLMNSPCKIEGEEKQKERKSEEIAEQFREKLSKIVDILPFKLREKECWSEMLEKIRYDRLFSMEKLVNIITKEGKEQQRGRVEDCSALMHHILSGAIDKFEELLLLKYKKGIFQKLKIKDNCREQTLRASLKQKAGEKNR